MSIEIRDESGTERLRGDLLIGGTTGQVATVQADGTIAPGTGSGGPSVASVPVTAVQLKALLATPITLVAAQGANTVVMPLSVVIHLTFNTVAYDTTNTAPLISWGNDVFSAFDTPNTAFWGLNQSGVWVGMATFGNNGIPDANLVDAPLMLVQDGDDLTVGNSPVLVVLTYTIANLA